MKIAVLDDYQNAFRTLKCYPKLSGHEVVVFTDTETDLGKLAEKLKDAEAVVLTQQRYHFTAGSDRKIAEFKTDRSNRARQTHVDLDACTERGIVISAGGLGNSNSRLRS